MNLSTLGCAPLLLLPLACASVQGGHPTGQDQPERSAEMTTDGVAEAADLFEQRHVVDAQQREALLGAVKALEGAWVAVDSDDGATATLFELTSAGSVVRETMMPGQPMEMVNMYSLDGNHLRMTHYCGGGNQPHMVASGVNGTDIVFAPEGVSDLKESDQAYMGSMTLRIVDEDTIEQHWYSHTAEGVTGPMVFQYKRAD